MRWHGVETKSDVKGHAEKACSKVWQPVGPLPTWGAVGISNTPHEATKEKPSFLLFGIDLRSPNEAALLPADPVCLADVEEYQEELIFSLSSARELAARMFRWRSSTTSSSMINPS